MYFWTDLKWNSTLCQSSIKNTFSTHQIWNFWQKFALTFNSICLKIWIWSDKINVINIEDLNQIQRFNFFPAQKIRYLANWTILCIFFLESLTEKINYYSLFVLLKIENSKNAPAEMMHFFRYDFHVGFLLKHSRILFFILSHTFDWALGMDYYQWKFRAVAPDPKQR